MFQLKFYIILLVVTVLGPINTFSAPVTKLDDGAVESETTTVENFSINVNNSTNNKLDEISSSSNIFISSSDISSTSSSISINSELIDREASTVISTDSYFISGLSDLLLENQDFDRVDEIETELENRSHRLTTLNRDDVTEVPTKIIAVSEVPLVLSTAKAMTKITKKQKSRIKSQTPTTTIPPELYTTDLNESPETKVSPIKLAIHSATTVTVNATDNGIIDATGIGPHTTADVDFTTIKIIDNNLEMSAPTVAATTTSSSTTSMPVAKISKHKKQLRKKYGQQKIDQVSEDNDDDGNQQVDFPTIPFVSTTISATNVESLHRSPIIVEQIEYETRNGTTAMANVTLNNKTEILEVEIFDQHLNVTNKESKQLSDDLVKVITSDDDLPSGSNFDVLEMGGVDMGMVPAQSGGNSSEYPLRTTLEKNDEFIYADVDDDTLKIHHKINTEKFPSTEMFNNKIFGDLLPSHIDRDSDTIFYISNTEVKVVESMPTPDSTKYGDGERMIPEIYEEDLIIDLNNQNDNNSRTNLNTVEKYSEDIILSPLKNNFDPIKNFNDENLSISYVGESFIDIEESTNTPPPSISTSQSTSDVIIQPVIIPDIPMSIGVPVIGELPPQLDLRNDHIMDDIHGRSTNDEHVITMKSQVLEHPGDNLFKNPLSADLREDTIDKKRTEAALSNRKNNATTSSNGTHDVVTNGTLPFGEENDDHESGFSDIQTLFLACILTLVPLILSVIVAFGVSYKNRNAIMLELAQKRIVERSTMPENMNVDFTENERFTGNVNPFVTSSEAVMDINDMIENVEYEINIEETVSNVQTYYVDNEAVFETNNNKEIQRFDDFDSSIAVHIENSGDEMSNSRKRNSKLDSSNYAKVISRKNRMIGSEYQGYERSETKDITYGKKRPKRVLGNTCISKYYLNSKMRNCPLFTEAERNHLFTDF